MIICIAEDRPVAEAGIQLLILSLRRHCSDFKVELFFPAANDGFTLWLQQFPEIRLHKEQVPGGNSWNVKPQVLLPYLKAGHESVVWLDSDIIVTRDFRRRLESVPLETLITTAEALAGPDDKHSLRARSWGFKVGRDLSCTLNTSVLRVSSLHIPLLERWRDLLEWDEAYKSAQSLPVLDRPTHLVSDQDILTALLASREFSQIDIDILSRGKEIVQLLSLRGYTCFERLQHIFGYQPYFIHSQGSKPWRDAEWHQGNAKGIRNALLARYEDVSPYKLEAKKYKKEISTDTAWMDDWFLTGKLLRVLGLGSIPATGFPIAVLIDVLRLGMSTMALFFSIRLAREKKAGHSK